MDFEHGRFAKAIEAGAFVVSNDSRFPSVTLYKGANIIECGGSHDMQAEVRSGVGWKPNNFELLREVNKEGEVVNWEFSMLPILTPSTEETISEVVNNINITPGGNGRIEVAREIGGKLPRIVMHKNDVSTKVIVPSIVRLNINDGNIEFKDNSGGFNEPTETNTRQNPKYVIFQLPIDTNVFFPREVNTPKKYFIKSKVRLLHSSQQSLRKKIDEIIQNGSYSENRLRSIVNIDFALGKTYEEEAFA